MADDTETHGALAPKDVPTVHTHMFIAVSEISSKSQDVREDLNFLPLYTCPRALGKSCFGLRGH